MAHCLEMKAFVASQSPVRSQGMDQPVASSPALGQPAGVRQGSGSCGLVRSALQYVARAVGDLEAMLFPYPDLAARQPRLPSVPQARMASTPQVRHERKDAVAETDVQRNAPLIRQAVKDWLQAQTPGAPATGAHMFCDGAPGQWKALSAQLADLVVADCGPTLAQMARDIVTAAGTRIETAVKQVNEDSQQQALGDALAQVIGEATASGEGPLLSPVLARFLGDIRADVQLWTRDHGATGWRTIGLAGPNAMGNILFACGMRSVVEQLRREAQDKPPTPSSRYIEGRGGVARASEATLYGWLEKMCLDVGHGQPQVLKDRYGLFTAASLGKKADPAVRRLCAAIPYTEDLTNLTKTPLTPRLVRPGKSITSPVGALPHSVSSPSKTDSQRMSASRSESPHDVLSADEFSTRGRSVAQGLIGSDD